MLLLNQTPVKGGEISPTAGVHHFKPGSQITLKANAKPGYQFVHWLGDVSDATATKTMVYLNKPKVVVAVFEQAEYGAKAILPGAGGGGGGGGLMPTATNFYPQGGISAGGGGGGAKPSGPTINVNKTTPEVPEPATGVLMVMHSKVKPHVSWVTDSDSVRGYFRQLYGRIAYMEQNSLPSSPALMKGHTLGNLQHAPQLTHWPRRFSETGSMAVTVLFALAAQVFCSLSAMVRYSQNDSVNVNGLTNIS
ncbi:MAG: InlB B-repeat-containing protein [Planctomycetota bacterium]